MFRIFRTLRQRLLAENRVSRYLLYAIGEIILVVIGILIALQANNWNTVKGEEQELNDYLLTIAQNIKSDLPVIQELKNKQDSVYYYTSRFWTFARKEHYDFEDARFLAKIITASFEVPNFNANQTGFESLRTSGLIGKIQGTALAEALFEYYRKAGIINNLVDRANTYSQAMQIELMKQEFTPGWIRLNGFMSNFSNEREIVDPPKFWTERQSTLRNVIRHPAVYALMARNSSNRNIQAQYEEISLLGSRIIQDIENRLK